MTRQFILKLVAGCSVFVHALLWQSAVAVEGDSYPSQMVSSAAAIDSVTNNILLRQTELERYYLQYRIRGSEEPKWRQWRYFALQQLAASGFIASTTVGMTEFGGHLNNPSRENDRDLRDGYFAGFIGSIAGGGGDGLELASNTLLALKHKRHGLDPGTVKANVIARLRQIDDLLAKRRTLVAKLPDEKPKEIFASEGVLLKEYRDLCAYEFADAYANIKSYQSSSNVFYVLDFISESLAAVSFGLSVKGVSKDNLNGPAILAGLVADCVSLPSAPLGSLANSVFYKRWRARFAAELGETLDDTKKQTGLQVVALNKSVAEADSKSLAALGQIRLRLAVYSHWSTRYETFIDKETQQLERLEKVARQYNRVGPVIALGNLGQDVVDTVGFYHFGHRDVVATHLYFAGSVSSGAASLGSFSFTNYRMLDDLRFEQRSRRERELPQQLLQTRLKTLDEIESKLADNRP